MQNRILPFFVALPVIFLSNNLAAQEYDCSLGSAYRCFSDSAINGLGVTYSFSPYGLNNDGFKLRLEAGRGKISNRDGYYNGANLVLSCQF